MRLWAVACRRGPGTDAPPRATDGRRAGLTSPFAESRVPPVNRANLIGDPRGGEFDYPLWFAAATFGIPADGEYGDSPRAPLRLPGRNQTDLAVSKNFYFSSTGRIQFRADMINAFNHTQFTTVNADSSGASAGATTRAYTNSPVGTITGVRAPREIQLSLKLYW
jgi:hypothetical protein